MPTGQPQTGLHIIDYGVITVYMLGVLGVGYYFSRRQSSSQDYFLAGRRMPWFAVGLSIVATLMSTLTYLGAPGEMIKNGVAQALGWITLPLSFLVISFLWLPFFMRLELTSVYEYLELRYGLVARWVGAGLFVVILRLGWMGVIVLTASRAVAQITYPSAAGLLADVLHWKLHTASWTLFVLLSVGILATVYTMLGGIKAVIWTDVAQTAALFLGVLLTLLFVARDTGTGPVDWWRAATSHKHEPIIVASWDITERNTLLWTSLAAFFWYVCTFACDQVAMQRFFTTPSARAAIWSNAVNFVADLSSMILLALCGMALLTYYERFPMPGVSDVRTVADTVFPHFIAHGLPVGISGLVVSAVFAVAMSSLDSGVNSVSTVLTVDVFRRLRGTLSAAEELRLARLLTVVIGLFCTGLAWLLMLLPEEFNIIDVTLKTFNCALGPLAAMFVAGMFLPRVGQRAIVTAALSGLCVAVIVAWWARLGWLIGMIDAAEIIRTTGAKNVAEALQRVRSPSVFLVTPLAFTWSLSCAICLGFVFHAPDREKVGPLTWRYVVLGR